MEEIPMADIVAKVLMKCAKAIGKGVSIFSLPNNPTIAILTEIVKIRLLVRNLYSFVESNLCAISSKRDSFFCVYGAASY